MVQHKLLGVDSERRIRGVAAKDADAQERADQSVRRGEVEQHDHQHPDGETP